MGLIKWLREVFTPCRTAEVTPEYSIASAKTLISWKGRDIEPYHWWPMKAADDAAQYCNNLYAVGGGLDKYDKLFNTKSVEYQMGHHYRSATSLETDADWAGFCDCAATLSCLYTYPKLDVTVYYNGVSTRFNRKDIEALMIVACHNTVNHKAFEFYGERYNSKLDDTGEPDPLKLINILKTLCVSKVPFAMDVAQKAAVWNYAYNGVEVTVTPIPPCINTDKILKLKSDGLTNLAYYNFIIKSDAYPDKNLNIWGWSGQVVTLTGVHSKSGWLSDKHPDFIWRKYPLEKDWSGSCNINPEVSASNVFKIYQASLIPGIGCSIINL